MYLAWVVGGELGVVGHDVAIGSVGHKDEFALREGLEDFVEEEFADRESC